MRNELPAPSFLLALTVAALACGVTCAWGQWVPDGTALCTADDDQDWPKIVSDGTGGAITAWIDGRHGNDFDVYAQRVDGLGSILWAADGVPVCDAAGDQLWPVITEDGAGGAIIAWQDYRGADVDIYAQRVDATGATLWAAGGVALCSAANHQLISTITSDGAGGAIVTWMDYRGGVDFDVYVQRVGGSGAALWTTDGVALCTAVGNQEHPTVVRSGTGGAIVTWDDERTGPDDVYAQRVDATGAVLWTPDGAAVCTATGDQEDPTIATDGAGGAVITWDDRRTGFTDIYVQRVAQSGIPLWTSDGVAVCVAERNQYLPQILSDDAGGAIVTWWDTRSDTGDVYASRVDSSGALVWEVDGVALCTATGTQKSPSIASDGYGGAIVSWSDRRTPSSNIYAQRIDAAGSLQWEVDGAEICTAKGYQGNSKIIQDGEGGAVLVWRDERSTGGFDVYALRVCDCGVSDVPIFTPDRESLLGQNAPNPFTFSTRIKFRLQEAGHVSLRVFDARGRLVRVLVDGYRTPRGYTAVWDGRSRNGTRMPAGTYFCRLDAHGWSASKKITLAK